MIVRFPNTESHQGAVHDTAPDGWMICDFTSFSTVFQSYQEDGWVIMKGCVQWNSVNPKVLKYWDT